jgi:hypothetical protein
VKLLVVTHSYAPDATPRAYRWTAIAAHWAEQGHDVHVVTTGRRGGPSVAVENGVTVHRVGERAFGALHRGAATATSASGVVPKRSLAKRIYDATWKRLYWPDYAATWYFAARNYVVRLCHVERFDAVVTVSHPFTGQLVGLALRRRFPRLRWIADIGDPFSVPGSVAVNNAALYAVFNRRAEGRVLDRCDAASVTVEGCRVALANAFPRAAHKISVIPPLLSLPEADTAAPARLGEPGKVHLAYLGMLYPGIREPGPLLALFAAMHRKNPSLRLHFFGDVSACAAAFAGYAAPPAGAVEVHGPVARREVGAIMAGADVLVNIANGTGFQLPSKLVEYVHAGRLILNVAPNAEDTAAAFLADYPAALSLVVGDTSVDDATVARALAFIAGADPVPPASRVEFLAPYRLEPIAAAYARLLAPAFGSC